MKKNIIELVLLAIIYFLLGVAIFFFESEVLFTLHDFTISDRLILNQINLILFVSMGVILLLVSSIVMFRKKNMTKSSWILWVIRIVLVISISVYWCVQLQWK